MGLKSLFLNKKKSLSMEKEFLIPATENRNNSLSNNSFNHSEEAIEHIVLLSKILLKIKTNISVINEQLSRMISKIETSTILAINKFFALSEKIKDNNDKTLELNDRLKKKLIFDICNAIFRSSDRDSKMKVLLGNKCEGLIRCEEIRECIDSDRLSYAEEIIKEIKEKVKEDLISTINFQNSYLYKKINSLSENIRDIKKLSQDIEYIAKTINLLALNASIESARAGEYGRGFAVIADEIRKLSDHSNKTAKEIKNLLNPILNSLEETYRTISSTSKVENTAFENTIFIYDSIISSLVSSFQDIYNSFDSFILDTSEIRNTINSIISDLQFEDITKQMSTHITQMLNDMSNSIENIEILKNLKDDLLSLGIKKEIVDKIDQYSTMAEEREIARNVIFGGNNQIKETKEDDVTFF